MYYATVELGSSSTGPAYEIIAYANSLENEEEEGDPDSPMYTITAGLQHLSKIQKILSSLGDADVMLGYLNKIQYFLLMKSKQPKKNIFCNKHY